IYISGDTEDIEEMRNLKNIDIAFICMNLPYTMDIKQAANAVLDFKPKIVYPFHYRGKPNMSDTKAFKTLVNKENSDIEVRLRNWYPDYD
ncbi:MAG: MBL fold metallo-hydrolase, partial [Flavobacteriaceae bacterium]|nr:MBL fold metallo-hydrolase [Flavobacteriaceae bacterium]